MAEVVNYARKNTKMMEEPKDKLRKKGKGDLGPEVKSERRRARDMRLTTISDLFLSPLISLSSSSTNHLQTNLLIA